LRRRDNSCGVGASGAADPVPAVPRRAPLSAEGGDALGTAGKMPALQVLSALVRYYGFFLRSAQHGQALFQIGDQVFDVFDAH
jgi:hypothetical protein